MYGEHLMKIKDGLHGVVLQKSERVSSRLDFWLISLHLMFDVESKVIKPSIKTDHSSIIINLNLKKTPERGRGFWKINNSLLMDKDYTKLINSLLENCSAKFQNVQNKALVWDCIKCEIRGATIQFAWASKGNWMITTQ